ncbi:early flowering 3 [Arabis alpina]|uniref:Early flowering 3 n=1 Tax=Arabis alpina TaxID=50452 RepID=A0A087GJ51_ARAAL|nr:early flowering 3 [Arabis alpina]
MRRGKDCDEKILEPMFPRLHVNDSDNRGGPRAPPRNKMALYEQLSIPSQRFNNHTLVPPEHSSTQACAGETFLYVQQQVSSAAIVHSAENFVTQGSYIENVRSQRKMVGEEDDFAVPVLGNSRKVQSYGTNKNVTEKVKPTSLVALSSRRSSEIQEVNPEVSKQNDVVREQVKENMKQGAFLYKSAREEMNVDKSDYYGDNRCDASSRQESRNRFDGDGETCGNGVESQLAKESNSGGGNGSPDEVDNGDEYGRSGEQQRNEEASDDGSENSMVDSILSENVSPDDIVGVIGQKRFWRARKAINNQQRLFAVQLFELHRLIKVQRLIAASPDLLLDDVTYLGRGSAKSSPLKKLLPSEYIVKPQPRVAKHRDDSEKTSNHHKMECSAENAFGRTHVSPVNPPASPAASNGSYKTPTGVNGGGGGWCFPPPQPIPGNNQWLIPVMSPSEGLIYKPYPGPGHTGPACGGYYGHYNIPTGPTYGLPNPAFHPGVGFPSYFPPYGMPNPSWQQPPTEQTVNQFSHPGNLHNPAMNTQQQQQQSSCNFPPNSNTANRAATTPQPHPHPPPIRSQPRIRESSNGSEPQRLAKTTTVATRVIRVVPHNARLASENAARIFQSIQEERKLYEL